VTAVSSGAAALEALRQGPFELVVIDFAMPGINGGDTAALVRAECPALPILFITGHADPPALRAIGKAEILQKPFVTADLIGKLPALLGSETDSPRNVIRLRREPN